MDIKQIEHELLEQRPIAHISVCMSNSTDALLNRLKEKIGTPHPDPFYKVLIVVPDGAGKKVLQLALAKELPQQVTFGIEIQDMRTALGLPDTVIHLAAAYAQQTKKYLAHHLNDLLALEAWKNPKAFTTCNEVHFFPLTALCPEIHQFLLQQSKTLPIHYYVLSPCMLYWGDIYSDKEAKKIATLLPLDPMKELLYDRSKLLANNASLGREFATLIDASQTTTEEHYAAKSWQVTDPCYSQYLRPEAVTTIIPAEPCLLDVLQADLLLLGPKRLEKLTHQIKDRSVQVHNTPTIHREIEVLYQEIQSFLRPQAATVIVFAPDIEMYRASITALFPHSTQILGAQTGSLIRSFWQLFELVHARFLTKKIFTLFHCDSFRAKCSLTLEDLSTLSTCLQKFDFGDELFFERVAKNWLGIENSTLEFSNSEAEVIGASLATISNLLTDLAKAKERMNLSEWLEFFHTILETYFEPTATERSEYVSLKETLLNLTKLKLDSLDLFQAQDLVQEGYNERAERSINQNVYPITFASLGQLRGVSADMICLLGMNEGDFPRTGSKLLGKLGYMHSSRSSAKLGPIDRVLFIEAILAARKALYLSYLGYSFIDRTKVEPAAVIVDVLELLEAHFYLKKETLVSKHPLDSGQKVQTFSEPFSIAKELTSILLEVPEELSLQELSQVAKSPLKAYFQKGLGLYLRESEKSVPLHEFEKLEHYFVKESLRNAFFAADQSQSDSLKQAYRLLPQGLQTITLQSLQEEFKALQDKAQSLQICASEVLDIELSRFCDKAEQSEPGKWKIPALSFIIDGKKLELVGQLKNIHPKGIISFGSKNFEATIRAWPELLVIALLEETIGIKPAILFLKEAKQQACPIRDPQKLLTDFISYAFTCRKTPLCLYPDWIKDFLTSDPIAKHQFEGKGFTRSDPYLSCFLSRTSPEDFLRLWPTWQEWAQKLYGAASEL